MAALARPHVDRCTPSQPACPARRTSSTAARWPSLRSEHREIVPSIDDLLAALPQVIYHLESFDALLVRSSVLNYLVARAHPNSSRLFSGEGGDELFAGYDYIKGLPRGPPDELIDITSRLHNTALQRVNRSPPRTDSSHTFASSTRMCWNMPCIFRLNTSSAMASKNGSCGRRSAMPCPRRAEPTESQVLAGSGRGGFLARYAEEHVSTDDFKEERELPNGWLLNSKEELLYYRIFKKHFGLIENLDWMGRTKGAPVS